MPSADRGTVTWAKMIECRFARVPKYEASTSSERRCFPSHKQERESDDRQVEHVYSMRLNAWKRQAPVNPLLPYMRTRKRRFEGKTEATVVITDLLNDYN